MIRRNPTAGFVLLDALVAFAIAAVALTVLFTLLPRGASQQSERLNRHLAMEFAFSVLEEYRATFPQMSAEGEDPYGWSWSIVETKDTLQTRAPNPLIVFANVTVTAWQRDRPNSRATLNATIARRSE
jgi:type II secretory pathway pseudopilin PulG